MRAEIRACIEVAACVCGKDGVISESEERSMFEIVVRNFPDVKHEAFDRILCEFFDSGLQVEDYLKRVEDIELRLFALRLAEESASSDGLELRENIALKKAYAIWGLESHASNR